MKKEESKIALERQFEKFLTAVEELECQSDQGRFNKVLRELLSGRDQRGDGARSTLPDSRPASTSIAAH